jgi:hypothetical protein
MARVVYVPNPKEAESVEAWFAAGLLRPLESSRPPQGRVDFR